MIMFLSVRVNICKCVCVRAHASVSEKVRETESVVTLKEITDAKS